MNNPRTFKYLSRGEHFEFDHAGLPVTWCGASGPWIKVSDRQYIHADARKRTTYTVGTISVKVVPA